MKQKLTQKYVKKLFEYKDGELYWKVSRTNSIHIGDKAGTLKKDGYCSIHINNKTYLTHRLIFLYYYGFLPEFIDHIDRNRSNNQINNLRKANKKDNGGNRKPNKNSSSKYKGVCWRKARNNWYAQITINGKHIYLGSFTDEWTAAFIYNVYARGLFGKFANLNNLGDD